jgi:hypothetical protein
LPKNYRCRLESRATCDNVFATNAMGIVMQEDQVAQSNSNRGVRFIVWGPAVGAACLVIAGVAIAAFRLGAGAVPEGLAHFQDADLVSLSSGAAIDVLAVIAGLGAAAIGAVTALIATIVGVSVGALGIALGGFIVLGVVTGPLLLVAIVAWAIKRRYWPDVI